jgi:hypothetical protein
MNPSFPRTDWWLARMNVKSFIFCLAHGQARRLPYFER